MTKDEMIKALADPGAGMNRVATAMGINSERLLPIYGVLVESANGLPANEAVFIAEILNRVWQKLEAENERKFAILVLGGWMEKTLNKKAPPKNIIVD